MKINNKGFIISTVLYSVLIAFMLILMLTLTAISNSTKIVSTVSSNWMEKTYIKSFQE